MPKKDKNDLSFISSHEAGVKLGELFTKMIHQKGYQFKTNSITNIRVLGVETDEMYVAIRCKPYKVLDQPNSSSKDDLQSLQKLR